MTVRLTLANMTRAPAIPHLCGHGADLCSHNPVRQSGGMTRKSYVYIMLCPVMTLNSGWSYMLKKSFSLSHRLTLAIQTYEAVQMPRKGACTPGWARGARCEVASFPVSPQCSLRVGSWNRWWYSPRRRMIKVRAVNAVKR